MSPKQTARKTIRNNMPLNKTTLQKYKKVIALILNGIYRYIPKGDFKISQRGTPIPYINTDVNTDNKQTPQAAMPDKSGESVTANDTLNATLRGSIASIKEEFEKLWAIYPNKQGKQHAYKAYERARKRKQNPVTYEQVKAGIEQYCEYIAAKGISKQYIKHGSTYFNGAEWESEYDLTPMIQTPTYYKQENQVQTDNSDTNNIFLKMLDEMRNEHDE